jgi:SAM-dependent methyltransferase
VSGAARSEWIDFTLEEFSFVDFAPGSRVLDVGCGDGEQLESLRRAGLDAIGVEPSASLVDALTARGMPVLRGVAEHLPVETASVDGLVCKVVVPYTDERHAIAEWARVVRPGGRIRAVYHGAGYYVRYLLNGPGLALRLYAARTLANTWWYALTSRRLPGFIGDTVYQSAKRLSAYYRDLGLELEREWPSPTFRGKPVFIYHELRRSGGAAR